MNNNEQQPNDILPPVLHKANVGGYPSLSEQRVIKFKMWLHSINKMTQPLPIEGWAKCAPFGCEPIWLQFTGLTDKNKKEIYEGDILKIETESGRVEYFVVKWGIYRRDMKSGWAVDIPSFSFVSAEGFPTFPIANNYLNGHDLDIIEVVGNIYENPDLLRTVQQ